MTIEKQATEAAQQYDAAYAAHYRERDLPLALRLYQDLLTSHAEALEANYARAQIHNIANAVVPKQELVNAEMELAYAHIR